MMKYSFLLLLFVACTSELKYNDSETLKQENNPLEIEQPVVAEEEITFNYFEDYAKLTSPEEIKAFFGKENCKSGTSWYAEGTLQLKHLLAKNKKNNHLIKYVFKENSSKEISHIEANYLIYNEDYNEIGKQIIKSECGISLGMKINELRKWNGKDFQFSGFGWDYGGGIFIQPGDKLEKCKTRLLLDMIPADNDTTFNELYGDQELSTKSALVQKAPIIVQYFAFYLD